MAVTGHFGGIFSSTELFRTPPLQSSLKDDSGQF
jgi:hypothetical protein